MAYYINGFGKIKVNDINEIPPDKLVRPYSKFKYLNNLLQWNVFLGNHVDVQ